MEHNFPFLGPPLPSSHVVASPRRPQVVNENQTTEKLHPLGGNHRPSLFHPWDFSGAVLPSSAFPFLHRISEGFQRPLRSTMFFQRSLRSLSFALYVPPPSSLIRSSPLVHPSLIYCIFAKMELIEVVFAAARYYNIVFDVTGKSNGVCTTTTGVWKLLFLPGSVWATFFGKWM